MLRVCLLSKGLIREADYPLCFFSDLPSVRLSVAQARSSNAPLTLYCDVESFYPEDVSVSWFQNGTALPDPPATDQNTDGTYTTRRYFTLSPEQRQKRGKVECAVNQPGVVDPVSTSADLDKLDPQGKGSLGLSRTRDLKELGRFLSETGEREHRGQTRGPGANHMVSQ
uniref:Ig-like domain-containing protein n=1 Tax=Fundulus heteroclitus TaxID=8078 RepID=A0A3Q2QP53_FUNHE